MIRRLLPYPKLAIALFAMWVVLTGFSPSQMMVAAIASVVISRVMLALAPSESGVQFSFAMVKLASLVFLDIVRSNIAVARIVLLHPDKANSNFIHLPTRLTNPYALAILATIITATPGTLWLQHDPRSQRILIHVLDLIDEEAWVTLIRDSYERLLLEIFQ